MDTNQEPVKEPEKTEEPARDLINDPLTPKEAGDAAAEKLTADAKLAEDEAKKKQDKKDAEDARLRHDPISDAVRFLLKHVTKHGDNAVSRTAQDRLDDLDPPVRLETDENQADSQAFAFSQESFIASGKPDPMTEAVRFLLKHTTKHFDNAVARQAQDHLDVLDPAKPVETDEQPTEDKPADSQRAERFSDRSFFNSQQ
jgi:hypothetical protein